MDGNYYEIYEKNLTQTEKEKYWNTAIGLQAVDDLKPSEYLIRLAENNIAGSKSYEEVEKDVASYYIKAEADNNVNSGEKEADIVALRIVKILETKSFSFNIATLLNYHKQLFSGVDLRISGKYIGAFRDYNISKPEPILNNDSVVYGDYHMLTDTLKYDFEEELQQKYSTMNEEQIVKRISTFTARIWQVHPFAEGNTRTTAVFVQMYLNSIGADVNNSLFLNNSKFFRNALVRANYSNFKKRIDTNDSYLQKFFENLLFNGTNVLDNNLFYDEAAGFLKGHTQRFKNRDDVDI